MDVETALRQMPKAELHLHLEGAVDVGTFAELAAEHGLELPPHDEVADLYQYDSLADFLLVYSLVCLSIRREDDFRRVTRECLARCADSGARYVELFFSPESHFETGVDYPTMLAGVLAGMADAKAERGLESNLIPAINRELGPARAVEFVEMVAAHPHPQVIGVGLDFNEIGFPSEDYVDAYRAAADHGLHRTSHAGEVGPADNVRAAIDLLDCERIDHGYHVIDDPELTARCVESQIPFTVCPTTTGYTTVWRDLSRRGPRHQADGRGRPQADGQLRRPGHVRVGPGQRVRASAPRDGPRPRHPQGDGPQRHRRLLDRRRRQGRLAGRVVRRHRRPLRRRRVLKRSA